MDWQKLIRCVRGSLSAIIVGIAPTLLRADGPGAPAPDTSVAYLESSLIAASGALLDEGPSQDEWRFDPKKNDWVAQETAPPGTADGDLAVARKAFANNDYRSCQNQIDKWIKTYGVEHERYGDALVLKARCLIARKKIHQAHKLLSAYLEETPGIAVLDEVLHYEFVIAEAFLNGAKREFLGMAILSGEELGLQILDDIVLDYPDSSVAELAIKSRADYYFRESDFTLAEFEYARLAQKFPRSRYLRYSLLKSADSALASFSGIDYDDAPLIEAEERYSNYLNQYPEDSEKEKITLVLQDIYAQRGAKEFEIARYYERAGRPRAAAFYYKSCADNWPGTVSAERATARLAVMPIPPPAEEEPPAQPPPPDTTIEKADTFQEVGP